MAYTLPAWANVPSTSTPLSAANLTMANTAINDLDSRTGTIEGQNLNTRVASVENQLPNKAPLASPAFTGTATFVKTVQTPVNLIDATTIAVDASLGNIYRVTLGGNRTMAIPTNGTNGQQITFEIVQDATGSRTVTWTSGVGGYAFGTDIATPVLSTAGNKRDFIGFYFNSTANRWYCLAVARGY